MSKDPGEEAESCTLLFLLPTCSCVQNGFQVFFFLLMLLVVEAKPSYMLNKCSATNFTYNPRFTCLNFLEKDFFMCMIVLPARAYVFHICAWCPRRSWSEKALDPLEAEL